MKTIWHQTMDMATEEDKFNSLEPDGQPTDPYKVEASKMFNVPYDNVTKAQRQKAKQAAFLRIYQ